MALLAGVWQCGQHLVLDELLRPVHDVQPAVLVEAADVARMHETILTNGFPTKEQHTPLK